MAKKRIILTNWDDSHRIGVAVESFEELKFKGKQTYLLFEILNLYTVRMPL